MKTKIMFVLMAFSIVAWVGASVAADGPTLRSDSGQGGVFVSPNRVAIPIWCQDDVNIDGGALASQEDVVYPFEAWMADDYTSPGDEAIESVQWWGAFFNLPGGPGTVIQPDYFVISFFDANDPNCDPGVAGPGVPTAPLFESTVLVYTAVPDGGVDQFEYNAVLDTPVPQDAGRTYWITIQAGMQFATHGQWGWQPTFSQQGCLSTQMFPLLGLDPWMAPATQVDMAFCLFTSDDPIAVETSSWGSVKALYK